MKTINVIVVSANEQIEFTISDVIEHWASEKGYYFIKTKGKNYYFPINQTILSYGT